MAAAVGSAGASHAALLSVSWLDQGDSNSPNLVSVALTFENTTGDYTIELGASSADPFQGTFLANVNLLNADTGSTSNDPALFLDNINSFVNFPASTSVELMGNNPVLLFWDLGDRVSHCLGVAGCTANFPGFGQLFGSGITGDELLAENSVAIIMAVPEPATPLLLALVLGTILLSRRHALS
jgi:hypothetical protein